MSLHNSLCAIVLCMNLLKFSCTSETIFITTNSSDHQCPAEPCLTLKEFASHYHMKSNTVLKFLPGKHVVFFNMSKNVSIIDMDNVTLTGVSFRQSSVIHCVSEFGIIAIKARNLTISSLHFSGCGTQIQEALTAVFGSSNILRSATLLVSLRSATLFVFLVSNVNVLHTHVYDSKGAGMLAVNTYDLTVYQTSFVRNIQNCFIWFSVDKAPAKLHVFLYIADSEFAYGNSDIMHHGGGLGLSFFQTSYTVYVYIINVTLYNNTGISFGNFIMTILEGSSKYTMVRTENIRSSNHFLRPSHSGFTVLQLISHNSISLHQANHSQQFEYTLYVLNSHFDTSMDGSAVDIFSAHQGSRNFRVKFTNITMFYSNPKNVFGFAFKISNVFLVVMEKIIVTNSTFSHIVVTNSEIIMQDVFILKNTGSWGIVVLEKSQVTFLGDIIFVQNFCFLGAGAIYAHSATLIFHGNVKFVNNSGSNGGALALYAGSEIVIGMHTHLKFIGNHANHFGGAIYVDNANHQMFSTFNIISCFYKLVDIVNTSINHYHVVLENNSADYAGSGLYGGWIDFCTNDQEKRFTGSIFDTLFQVNKRELDSSAIASNPMRVCLCIDSRPECGVTRYNISVYPGTTIRIPAVAVGQRFGTVPSTVNSEFLHEVVDGIHPKIYDWQNTQRLEKYCTNLTYTIISPSQVHLTMEVKTEFLDTSDMGVMQAAARRNLRNKSIDPDLYFTNPLINIEMLLCPLGFKYHNQSMKCTCDSKLVEYGLNCSINTQTVWRKSSVWITTTKEGGEIIVHEYCPFDYCKPDSFDLHLEDPDKQCAFYRSGILCGACQHNLSHVFGTSLCRECSNMWILLWVPVIALAGVALVVLLIVLNLTVSAGTINGLVFYANIVRANHATIFPPITTNSFLSWFIAWINLDLGIETCFYNGLDAYVKTWLQFVFPLYIWLLVIAIIVLSHYYTLAARLSGRNAVPVLATLFLLSYAKLLRIIITVFQSTELVYPDKFVRMVWLYDGNVDYLKGKHIPLFIAALLFLLITLPYTAILIFIQYLQHWSSYRVLFWVKKLKPLFDAYTGPYKDRHRYWTGLLLLVRILLFLVFSTSTKGSADINLLAIVVTVLSLLVYVALTGGIYKAWYLNVIEYSFFLNLGVLASATLYTIINGQGQVAVAYTSVSTAFTLFTIIVVFHMLIKLKSTQHYNCISVNTVGKLQVMLSKLRSALRKLYCKQKNPHQNTQLRVTHATIELRESLLEYCSQ